MLCIVPHPGRAKESSGKAVVIPPKSARLRESGLLDECAPQILRCAQDDSRGCHPERSEGSLADLQGITRERGTPIDHSGKKYDKNCSTVYYAGRTSHHPRRLAHSCLRCGLCHPPRLAHPSVRCGFCSLRPVNACAKCSAWA